MTEEKTTKRPLDKDMFISDAVGLYPEVVPIFMEYGLHCVGCFVAEMETILQGGLAHGMSEAEINVVVEASSNKSSPVALSKSERRDAVAEVL